jgi:hypothetical protein
MRAALRLLIFIWATVSVIGLLGLIYAFPGYSLDSAFSEALRKHSTPKGSFWFHWCLILSLVGICMTGWLYHTHRKHCGNFVETIRRNTHYRRLLGYSSPCLPLIGLFTKRLR